DIQEPVINNILQENNSLCLMPTGGGKSLIYQVAGLATGKTTLVISPLIALMEQQSQRLVDKGLNSIIFHGGITSKKQMALIKEFQDNPPDFIFLSPERTTFDGYLEFMLRKI